MYNKYSTIFVNDVCRYYNMFMGKTMVMRAINNVWNMYLRN